MDIWQVVIAGFNLMIVVIGALLGIGIKALNSKLDAQDKKIEGKLDLLLCSERMGNVKESCKTNIEENKEEHSEIFERLRKVEFATGGKL